MGQCSLMGVGVHGSRQLTETCKPVLIGQKFCTDIEDFQSGIEIHFDTAYIVLICFSFSFSFSLKKNVCV